MNNTREYFPDIYDGVREIDALCDSEDTLFTTAETNIEEISDNQYVLSSNTRGIELFELLFGIRANPATETLEFRRARVQSRFSNTPPYTLRYLQSKLDELIGVGKWTTHLDSDNYTLYIESSASDQHWYQEIEILVSSVKPANIIFVNRPLITDVISMNEKIELREGVFNYRLGVSWLLGNLPFASLQDRGVIKMSDIPSIQAKMLADIATFTASDIAKVRLNNTEVITSFTTKSATTNLVTVEYPVPQSLGITTITSVELLDSSNNVLTNASVYVPVGDSVTLKHTLTVKEG